MVSSKKRPRGSQHFRESPQVAPRVFARLERAPRDEAPPEEILAGATVKFLVKDDGDQYFQIPPSRSLDLAGLVQSIRRRVGS